MPKSEIAITILPMNEIAMSLTKRDIAITVLPQEWISYNSLPESEIAKNVCLRVK